MALVLAVAFGIGFVAGLRSFTAPMVVSWAARLNWMDLSQTWGAFLGYVATPYVLTLLAAGELIGDKLPITPSRKSPPAFAFRVIVGLFLGGAIAAQAGQSATVGSLSGGLGAVAGTLGGYEARTRLVKVFHVPDLVIALVEDIVAVGVGFFLVSQV